MIKDLNNQEVETFQALVKIVDSLNARFPDGKEAFQAVARLCEESGELAKAVNHREGSGIKKEKHGDPDDAEFLKEVQDVMVCAVALADHYGLLDELERSIEGRYQRHQQENFSRAE